MLPVGRTVGHVPNLFSLAEPNLIVIFSRTHLDGAVMREGLLAVSLDRQHCIEMFGIQILEERVIQLLTVLPLHHNKKLVWQPHMTS